MCLGVATDHDLCKTTRNISVCIEFKLPKVKVHGFFSATVGFSPRRDGCKWDWIIFNLLVICFIILK